MRRVIVLIISSVVALLMAELAARVVLTRKQEKFRYSYIRTTDDMRQYALKPGQYEGGNVTVLQEGTRYSTYSADTGTDVWFFGNSVIFGAGVSDSETIASMFAWLSRKEGKPAKVKNFGVPSYTSTQIFETLRLELLKGKIPDLLVISPGGNDFSLASQMGERFSRESTWKDIRFYLADGERRSALFELIKLAGREREREWLKEDNIERVYELAAPYVKENVKKIIDVAKEYRIPLVIVSICLKVRFSDPESLWSNLFQRYSSDVREICNQRDVPLVDIYQTLSKGTAPNRYFVDGVHPSADGARLVATEIYANYKNLLRF